MAAFLTKYSNRKTSSWFLREGGGPLLTGRRPRKKTKNMTIADNPYQTIEKLPLTRRRSIAALLAPLDQIAVHSPNLVANYEAKFDAEGETYELPRYLFVGPKGGDTPIRVGISPVSMATNRKARTRSSNSSNCSKRNRNWPPVIICHFIRFAIRPASRTAQDSRAAGRI